MLEQIRTWILGLAGAAVFCALATELTPAGMTKKVLRSLCGVIMALSLLSPLLNMDFSAYSLNITRYRNHAEALNRSAEEISEELNRRIIEEQCRTYILDKARMLDLAVEEATVRVRWSGEGFWYPVEADVAAPYSEELSRILEAELGIPRENQTWRSNENT